MTRRAALLRGLGTAILVTATLAWSTMAAEAGGPAVETAVADDSTTSTWPQPVQDLLDILFPSSTSSSTTSSTSTTSSSSTTTSSTTTTTTPPPDCEGARQGRTDVGVMPHHVTLGMVTVESGPTSPFLAGEHVAVEAAVARANAEGGICGRTIELEARDGRWDGDTGYQAIQDLSDEVFALVVNPDSRALARATEEGFLGQVGLPVIGTDGFFASQFDDPYIWPVGPPPDTTLRVIAAAQADAGLRHPSVVYESSFGAGRERADAYHEQWVRATGSGVPGHSTADDCDDRFCAIGFGQPGYGAEINRLHQACDTEPPCDAGVVALDPGTAATWFNGGGRVGGVADPSGGAGAAPPLLFDEEFGQNCGAACDGLRLWTALRPPVHPFADEPAVAQYVDDLRAQSETVDVVNQHTQAAYVGTLLTVHALREASTMPDGLTRANVVEVLDNTTEWNSGLTLTPLSWSAGDHRAATAHHAFDLAHDGLGPLYRYVVGSTSDDPFPASP